MSRNRSNALEGLRVLDVATMLAGPYAAMLLGGMGADVIKVEPPDGDPSRQAFGPPYVHGDSTYFQAVNQDKRSIALDLREDAPRAAFRRLLATADVLIHNLRPRSLERLRLTEETVRTVKPDIVYCSINAFGTSGPMRDEPGMDLVFQGLSGHMSLTGTPNGPPVRSAAQVVDVATGSYAASAILAALWRRERTGEAPRVDVNLIDVAFALQNTVYAYHFAIDGDPQRVGSGSYVSVTNCFPTADGHVNVTIPHDVHWRRLCRAIGRTDMLDDERYARNEDRVVRRQEIEAELRDTFARRLTSYWLDRLHHAGVPSGPVLSYTEALAHPQAQHNEVAVDLPGSDGRLVAGIATPLRISGDALGTHTAPPRKNEGATDVLTELGFSEEEAVGLITDQPAAAPNTVVNQER